MGIDSPSGTREDSFLLFHVNSAFLMVIWDEVAVQPGKG